MVYNPEIELAEKYITETGVSIFLTGKAGTGKTTFLHHIVERCRKRSIVVAPTGVAAVNAGGVTIHSFFQLPFCPYLPDVKELVTEYQLPENQRQLRKSKIDIIRTLDLLIIDEISMVRADLLDAVDAVMRRYRRSGRPFGGVQLLMIGDVQQLAPVVTDEERPYIERVYASPFFFHSKALQRLQYITIQLTTVYRQQDPLFLRLLNNIRDSKFDEATLAALNSRVRKPGDPAVFADGQEPILLTTHNWQADEVNRRNLEALDTPVQIFDAVVEGNFPDSAAPTERHLELKVGAQVMFVKNDSLGHRYYNGMIGVVESVETDGTSDGQKHIVVVNSEGERIDVGQERWDTWKYEIDSTDNQIKPILDGVFVQYPLKTAWAVTIHKAQGLTFDRLQVDASAAFTYGQVYVALSRCRSLEGLTLLSPITPQNAFENKDIEQFNGTMTPIEQAEEMLDGYRSQYYFDVLYELIDFSGLQHALEGLNRLYQELLRGLYPEQATTLTALCSKELTELVSVAERFHRQLDAIGAGSSSRALLLERVQKGAAYFGQVVKAMDEQVRPCLAVEIDNKETSRRLKEQGERYSSVALLKIKVLDYVAAHGFTVEGYQQAKVDAALAKPEKARKSRAKSPETLTGKERLQAMLTAWRRQKAEELGVSPFVVLWQRSLLAIVNALPTNEEELLNVPGMGKVSVGRYGKEILQIVDDYLRESNERRTPEEVEPKKKPEPTWKKAVQLMAEGKNLEEVAKTLNRAKSTVETYMLTAVEQGAMDADLILPMEAQEEIVAYLMSEDDVKLKDVYEHFDGVYSYLQLRVARWIARGL